MDPPSITRPGVKGMASLVLSACASILSCSPKVSMSTLAIAFNKDDSYKLYQPLPKKSPATRGPRKATGVVKVKKRNEEKHKKYSKTLDQVT